MLWTDERAAEHTSPTCIYLPNRTKKENMHRGNYIVPRAGVKSVEIPIGANG